MLIHMEHCLSVFLDQIQLSILIAFELAGNKYLNNFFIKNYLKFIFMYFPNICWSMEALLSLIFKIKSK
jgi:hypothetical protein